MELSRSIVNKTGTFGDKNSFRGSNHPFREFLDSLSERWSSFEDLRIFII